MNIKTKEIYSEVYQVLNLLGSEYIDRLPDSLFNMLKEKRDINYTPQYTEDIPLNKQNIKKEAISIIVLLYLNYWCEDANEQSELKQTLKNNEDRFQEEIRNKYNPNNIFKKDNQEQKREENIIENSISMIPYRETIFKKIINKIKSIFYMFRPRNK